MAINPARRMPASGAQFFAALEERLQALRGQGVDIIRLDIGSPDLPPPQQVIEMLTQTARRQDAHGYQAHRATAALREAWAHFYQQRFAVELNPDDEVVPLLGSKEGVFHLMQALVDPGDIVLVPDPGYMTYTLGAQLAGGVPYLVPLAAENGYLPDLAQIPDEIARRAKLIWLNYPNNPTGASADRAFFEGAIAFARRFDLLVCHDAAYTQVVFAGYRAPSILQIPGAKDMAIEFNTLSKSHNMAGWRTGVAVGNARILQYLFTYKTFADSGHFLPVLEAATQALQVDVAWIEERNAIYRQRRDLALAGLENLGLFAEQTRAGIYLWVQLPQVWSSEKFSAVTLALSGVSLTPGTVFGEQGEGYLRLSLTSPEKRIAEALQRIKAVYPQIEYQMEHVAI